MQKITTFLTFKDRAEEAVNFYVSIFRNSRVVSATRMDGKFVTATFELDGQTFMALNGGSTFSFAQGISLFVSCEDQAEVDRFWGALSSDGGKEGPCGWVTDRFGVAWQVVPEVLGRMINDENPHKAQSVVNAMLQMSKMDIAKLEQAYRAA